MKEYNKVFIFAILLLISCGNREFFQVEVENPQYKPNTIFTGSEDLTSPKFAHLIEKYQLDTIFHGETDELKRILLLRQWIRSVVPINDFGDPYPGGGYVEGILDNALQGQGYHCGHYMKVQNGIMNAFGYVTRTLGAGPGVKGGPDGHHGINEIWLNDYNKWFLSDAKYDHHFEKNGIPLSTLEIRDEFLKNKSVDITMVNGPERIAVDFDEQYETSKERFSQTYTWIEFHGHNDMFTVWPNHKELLIMYDDDFFENNTWIWGDKPHWAYAQPEFMVKVKYRDAIEWTPNTIDSKVTIEGNKASIEIISETPNLKEYQMKDSAGGEWKKVEEQVNIDLKENKYDLVFRAVNLAGVAGPLHRVVIDSK